MVEMGGGASVSTSGVTSGGTSRVTSRGASAAAMPCEEGGIGVRYSNIAGAGCSEG